MLNFNLHSTKSLSSILGTYQTFDFDNRYNEDYFYVNLSVMKYLYPYIMSFDINRI